MSDRVLTSITQRAGDWPGESGSPPSRPASYEEYLSLSAGGRLVEWVNGHIIYHMPPTTLHQLIADYLGLLLSLFVEFFNQGRVIRAAFEMKCRPDGPSREPDLIYVSNAHLSRLDDRRLNGPADLAVEVVSEDSVTRDYDEKYVEYEECGVREYWLIDPRPRRQRALFYQLDENGKYDLVKPIQGVYRSRTAPGFWLKVDRIWQRPDPQLTFAEIAGFPPEIVAFLKAQKQKGLEQR